MRRHSKLTRLIALPAQPVCRFDCFGLVVVSVGLVCSSLLEGLHMGAPALLTGLV